MNEEIDRFKKKYNAHVQQGRRQFARPKPITVDSWSDPELFNTATFEYENGVQIDMPESDFEQLVHMEKYFRDTLQRGGSSIGSYAEYIVDNYDRECRIRNENPSVRVAYEKYQTLLKLVDSHYR